NGRRPERAGWAEGVAITGHPVHASNGRRSQEAGRTQEAGITGHRRHEGNGRWCGGTPQSIAWASSLSVNLAWKICLLSNKRLASVVNEDVLSAHFVVLALAR